MSRRLGKPIIALLLAASANAAEIDSASLAVDLSYGYATEFETSMLGELDLQPAATVEISDRVLVTASARLRLDARDDLEPGRPATDTYASGSRPLVLGTAGTLEVRDFFVELVSRNGITRFGKQQIVWGRLDGIKVLDLLNPQNFREFILDDFGDSRTGLWSAYTDYNIGNWRTEFAIVPDATSHAIPVDGAWFELTAPRFRFGADPAQPSLPSITARPGHSLGETAFGLRLSRQAGTAEFAMVAFSGMDPEPLGRIVSVEGEPMLQRYFERRDALGVSIDIGLGAAVLRTEYAYQPDRMFNVRGEAGLDAVALDQHRGAVGIDVEGPFGLFINAQYLVDFINGSPDGLVRPDEDRIGTLFVRKSFAYDRLIVEARWYRSFTDDDQLVSLGIDYALSDRTSLSFAMQAFAGTEEGLFGQFAQRDRLLLSLGWTF